MKKVFVTIIMVFSLGLASVALLPAEPAFAGCNDRILLGFPSWCRGLKTSIGTDGKEVIEQPCAAEDSEFDEQCKDAAGIKKDSMTVFIWKIILNISEILFILAGMISLGFAMYAGLTYLISQGQADKIGNAKKTLQNALIGLAIAILATAVINTVMGVIIG
ncbi:MAG: pilin [Candidatus Nomurabacteria bacterium]|nr:pilin [Candidatus Nomurabacteria bacterium]